MITTMAILANLFGLQTQVLFAQENPRRIEAVDLLLSKDSSERKKGRELIFQRRSSLISQLTAVISGPGNYRRPGSVEAAMLTLGELRAWEASGVLVAHICFPYLPHPETGESRIPELSMKTAYGPIEKRMPAVSALIQIGEPCIDQVIQKLSTADRTLEIKACQRVLEKLSERPSVATMLERAIERAAPGKQRQLKDALEMLGEEPTSTEKR